MFGEFKTDEVEGNKSNKTGDKNDSCDSSLSSSGSSSSGSLSSDDSSDSSSDSSDSSSSSSSPASSSSPPPSIHVSAFHSRTVTRSSYLGRVSIPLSDLTSLSPGASLIQTYLLAPCKGQSTKHVQGSLEIRLVNSTVKELLSFLTREEKSNSSSLANVLQRSRAARDRSVGLSQKVDAALDKHWNLLEGSAAGKIDKMLVAEGLIDDPAAAEKRENNPVSYIRMVMTGQVFGSMWGPSENKQTNSEEASGAAPSSPSSPSSSPAPPLLVPQESAVTKRNRRKIQSGAELQELNRGAAGRAAAMLKAGRRGARMRAWEKYDEGDEGSCVEHPFGLGRKELGRHFGVAVDLHFSLNRWLQVRGGDIHTHTRGVRGGEQIHTRTRATRGGWGATPDPAALLQT